MSKSSRPKNTRFAAFQIALSLVCASMFGLALFTISSYQKILGVTTESGFVTRSGKQFILGGQPFQFVGVNSGFLTYQGSRPPYYRGCGTAYSDDVLPQEFTVLDRAGVKVIRLWTTQLFTASGTDFSRLDLLIQLAKQHNMKLMLTLENQWKDCTEGGYKYDTWYKTGYLFPYGSYTKSYKDYVKQIVTRYKNEPTIFAWELMNEAESKSTANKANPDALYAFSKDMSETIKTIAPNHLVTLGGRSSNEPGIEWDNSLKILLLPGIDFLDVHNYAAPTLAIDSAIQKNIDIAAQANKPVIIGENGINSNCSDSNCVTPQLRVTQIKTKMDTFFAKGGNGYLLWIYANVAKPKYLEINASDPLLTMLQNYRTPTTSPTISPTPTPPPSPKTSPTPSPKVTPSPSPKLTPSPTPKASPTPSSLPSTNANGLVITQTVTSKWATGYCATVSILNTSSSPVTQWTITFPVTGRLKDMWNATWSQSGNIVTASGLSWNSKIQPNKSVTGMGYCTL